MNIKENWKTMCRKYVPVGIAALREALETAGTAMSTVQGNNLQKPKWDDICYISEYRKRGSCANMIVNTKAEHFAEFAERYTSEITKDPNKLVSISITTIE